MTETLPLLDRLVAFPTVSAESNLPLIEFVEAYLGERGFDVHRVLDGTGTKAGLFARIGPAGPGGVMLSAHSDVVPVAGQDWTGDPFRLRRAENRLLARGATDMKAFLASTLALADRLDAARLREPLKLAISWDEEVGCRGIPVMLPHLDTTIGKPALCIVGEPTLMQVAIGHKGKAVFRATCTGQAGHSAMAPNFVNALHLATDFVGAIRAIQSDLAATGARGDAYDIPYTTLHVGRLQGGKALNIVPDHAVIELEYRHLPGDDPTRIDACLALEADRIGGIALERIGGYPGLEVADRAECVAETVRLTDIPGTTKVGYGTEAGYFAAAGIPTVICGPGSMDQGHIGDEFIELEQIEQCDRFMDRVASRCYK